MTASIDQPSQQEENKHEEYQYLTLIQQIINSGELRNDRTNTGTLSVFVPMPMRYSLRNNQFPLLTTKRVFHRGVIEELLFFLRGSTNGNLLTEKNVHIWDEHGSKTYLTQRGLAHREEGDLGPIYGFQWRHFGAQYQTMADDYSGQGIDQIAQILHMLRTDKYSRRILLTAWNPICLNEMALPPCHVFAQFYVSDPLAVKGVGNQETSPKPPSTLVPTDELNCMLYQRSADMGLGVPFNIASYALLTRILAHLVGIQAGELVHVIGDAHVYLDHVEPLKVQLMNTPKPFPTLKITRAWTPTLNVEDFTVEDFVIENYHPHRKIEMKMSV